MAERVRDERQDGDPPADAPELEPLYRVLLRIRESDATPDERSNPHVRAGMVKRALRFMVANGLADEIQNREGTHRIRSRFRVLVKDAAHTIGTALATLRDAAREERA
jgi:hypothetical protein